MLGAKWKGRERRREWEGTGREMGEMGRGVAAGHEAACTAGECERVKWVGTLAVGENVDEGE